MAESLLFANAFSQQSKRSVARVNERLDAALIAAAQDAEETCGMIVIGGPGAERLFRMMGQQAGSETGFNTAVGISGRITD